MKHKKHFFTIFFGLIFSLAFCISSYAQENVYNGPDVNLYSQTQVTEFAANNYTTINANVTIWSLFSPDITDLSPLSSITSISGDLWIFSCAGLTNLQGLQNLTSVGVDLRIQNNANLRSIAQLGNITSIGDDITIEGNSSLINLTGLEKITSVNALYISTNTALTDLHALGSLTSVNETLTIGYNSVLTNLDGLESLTYVKLNLYIWYNALTDLDGLKNLGTVDGTNIEISNNTSLVSFCGLYHLFSEGTYPSLTDIYGNLQNPSVQDIKAAGPCFDGSDFTVVLFQDDFESYTAGQRLACQNSTDWNTWSLSPCNTIEDPYISSSYASSGSKSVVIIQDNDLIKPLGDVATGCYLINFRIYIPSGKAGYFNTLSEFTVDAQEWAMECYFDVGGGGRLFAGATDAITFAFAYNSWQELAVLVNLDSDVAEFWFNGSMIYSWQWTLGANGGVSALMLAASDFYGATADDEMYIDEYRFVENPGSNILVSVDIQPGTCPNSLNVKNKGYIPVAILGTADLDVQDIDPETLLLEGISPLRWSIKDVATPVSEGEECDCTSEGPDGFNDLNLKFDTQEVIAALGEINDGDELVLTLTGNMLDGTPIEGSDCVIIKAKGLHKDLAGNLSVVPEEYALFGNYPNPFNPSTTIEFAIPEESFVKLEVYNTLGERVNTLVAETLTAGIYSVDWNAADLSSGVYIYRLQAGSFVETKKMVLMK